MNNTSKNFQEVSNKYGFGFIHEKGISILTAKNTDGQNIEWIKYNEHTDLITYRGNTDNCNIWLCDTRKDLKLEDIKKFIEELNIALELENENCFKVEELIDLEDLQEIK